MGKLYNRCKLVEQCFKELMSTNSRTEKETTVNWYKARYPKLVSDLDYCFEVLAGKHKLGYTYFNNPDLPEIAIGVDDYTIEQFIERTLKGRAPTDEQISMATINTPINIRPFIATLVNREYKVGYSNKQEMIDECSPMLAKKYQDTFKEQYYYIQEKLDGNRCIAYFDYELDEWCFKSRSGKFLKVDFDMSWVDEWCEQFFASPEEIEYPVFDGEIMTLEHAGSRDFNRTSGAINGKYTDKSGLHYFIYDIIAPKLKYEERKEILDSIGNCGPDCQVLPVLDKVYVYPNHDYNCRLDEWLDKIVDKGGEGLILRDPNGYYQCGKRSDGLLKYKKTQTMDLRIIDWNEGSGKYEGALGSFLCRTDDGSIIVNVSGLPDDIHYDPDPSHFIGKIIEVAYFDISVNSANGQKSLRFPRLKKFRDDKDTTSIY